jgi:zinc D-Ala-D-Ala dipeptidase
MRLLIIVACLIACTKPVSTQVSTEIPVSFDSVEEYTPTITGVKKIDSLESALRSLGLIDVQLLNPELVVDLQYSTDSNFLHQNIYGQLSKAFLEENAAKKIALAQYHLSASHPELRIKIWDAARPVSCQRKMWNALQMPIEQRGRFVSNPKNHSLHNYGCAVDVTLVDSLGIELDLGSRFDQFDSLAQPRFESHLLEQEQLSRSQVSYRWILRKVMKEVGFSTISSEWWHFNACTRQYAKEHYSVIE